MRVGLRSQRPQVRILPGAPHLSDSFEKALIRASVRVRYPTPLRYPGGKARLGAFFAQTLIENGLIGSRYLEAFAGGAGVGLFLLQSGIVQSIALNDLDRAIYAFWYAATRRNEALRRL